MADRLDTPFGGLRLDERELHLEWRDGTAVRTGDGTAAALARAVVTSDASELIASPGHAVVTAPSEQACTEWTGADLLESAIDVDQTHLSVVVAGPGPVSVVVKVIRGWGRAERAARALGRLHAAGSTDVPRFRGRVDWAHPVRGCAAVALVSDLVPNATDGWTWAVADVIVHVRDCGREPAWPRRLGELTARVHSALARDRVPAPAGIGRQWRTQARSALELAAAVTEGSPGERLRHRLPAMAAVIDTMPDDCSVPLFSIHGDLHVGQVLRSGDTYRVVDFDGDPQNPVEHADDPEPAARDVAHLLVSVDQVACVAQRHAGQADPRYPLWAANARRTLLDAYRTTLAEVGSPELFDERAIPALEVQQLAREMTYAARFLPRWAYAGDGAVTARFPRRPGVWERPWTPPPLARA